MWIGQSVDTSVLTARVPEFRGWPMLTSLGCAIRKPRLIETRFQADLKSRLGITGPLMLDSGGFVLMKRHVRSWGVRKVAAVYEAVEADVLVSLDHPPALGDTLSERRAKYRRTFLDLDFLLLRCGGRLMPVVHGRTPEEVESNCRAIRMRIGAPRWVGLGGLVPLLQRSGNVRRASSSSPHVFIAQALRIVRANFPKACLHVFGAGGPQTLLALFGLGADSADSIGWRQAAGFGSIYLPGRSQRLLSWTKSESPRPRPLIDRSDRRLLLACQCPSCRPLCSLEKRISELDKDFTRRAIHNLWVLRAETNLFRASNSSGAGPEILKTRLSDTWLAVLSTFGCVA